MQSQLLCCHVARSMLPRCYSLRAVGDIASLDVQKQRKQVHFTKENDEGVEDSPFKEVRQVQQSNQPRTTACFEAERLGDRRTDARSASMFAGVPAVHAAPGLLRDTLPTTPEASIHEGRTSTPGRATSLMKTRFLLQR
ncbi:hypothetical protein Trydic_g13337 [Trypoxylus dichotomus]